MPDKAQLPQGFIDHLPWHNAKESIWPVVRFTLHRNLAGFPFPEKLPESSASQLLSTLFEALKPDLKEPLLLMASDLAPLQREFLYEHFLLREGYEKYDHLRGFVIDNSSAFLAMINLEDHLVLHMLCLKDAWQEGWQKISNIERRLDKELSFAFSNRFGYLTASPFLAGTGLICEAALHLPALMQSGKFHDSSIDLHNKLLITGLGQTGEFLADLALIENKYKLLASEESLINQVIQGSEKLASEEIKLRESLKTESCDELKDRISRAFGILAHSFQLPTSEALSSLSLLELGHSIGWVETKQPLGFRDLFFALRRAHLMQKDDKTPSEALLKKRADILHEILRDAKLHV